MYTIDNARLTFFTAHEIRRVSGNEFRIILFAVKLKPWKRNFVTLLHLFTHAPGRTPLNQWAASRRDCCFHNTQQTQGMNIHAVVGTRTRDPNNRAAADVRLRPHVLRDRLLTAFQIRHFLLARSLVVVSFIDLGPFAHWIALLLTNVTVVNLDRFMHYICLSCVVS